jgi:trigger factor
MPDVDNRYYKGIVIETSGTQRDVQTSRELLEDVVIAKLMELSDVEVSEDKLEEEVSYLATAHSQRMKYDHIFSGRIYMPLPDELAENVRMIREETHRSMRAELILKQIVEAEGLDVTDAEVEEEAARIAERQEMSLTVVKDFLGADLASLRHDLLLDKALDLVCQHAVFV